MRILVLLSIAALALAPCMAQDTAKKDDPAKTAGKEGDKPAMPSELLPPPDPATAQAPTKEDLKTFTEKDAKGNVILKYQGYKDKNGRIVKHGEYVQYYADGSKRRQVTYKFNRPDGFER